MRSFVYQALPMRVVFGPGALDSLRAETDLLGLRRLLVLSTPGRRGLADRAAALLGERAVGVFAGARMHVPVSAVTAAAEAARAVDADGCVAVGGGSAIGLAKAMALREGLAFAAVPTTYAGSEMTPVWGMTENARKQTGRDRSVLPRSVLYDPELTLALPVPVSVTSGLNAMAHAVEALYAPDGSPVVAAMAEQGVRDLATALPTLGQAPADLRQRAAALQGAWLCGACLGATTMGLHHKLCHVLGGLLDLPHADTHAVMLPYVAGFNLPAAPDARVALARALDADDPAGALGRLARELGAPRTLRRLGVRREELAAVAEEVLAAPCANPRPVGRAELHELLERAWSGG